LKIGGRLVIINTAARVSRTSASFHLIGGGTTAKEDDARARARRLLRPVSLEEEMLVRNLADAAESFPSIEGLISISLMERIRNRVGEPLFPGPICHSNSTEYVRLDEPRAVTPLDTAEIKGLPDTYSRRARRDVEPRPDLHMELSWVYEFEARDKHARRAAKS
jgi:hypothetical protein